MGYICNSILVCFFFTLCNFKLVDEESESAFLLFFTECAHCQTYFTQSLEILIVNDPKDAISVVQVNKMLAILSGA